MHRVELPLVFHHVHSEFPAVIGIWELCIGCCGWAVDSGPGRVSPQELLRLVRIGLHLSLKN